MASVGVCWRARGPAGRAVRDHALGRYRVELFWATFAIANFAAMIAWPTWRMIPFHLVWISLTIVYGFYVWPARITLALLAFVLLATALVFASRRLARP